MVFEPRVEATGSHRKPPGMYGQFPGAVGAEQAVLGLILEGSEATERIFQTLGPGRCFTSDRHRIVYQAALSVRRSGRKSDLPTAVDELSRSGLLAKAGGAAYISGLLNKGLESSADQYCQEIIEASHRADFDRALWSARVSLRNGQDVGIAARQVTAVVENLITSNRDKPGYKLKSITEILAGNSEDISWCVQDLLPANGLGILSGESGCGKTWLILTLALSVAHGHDWLGRFHTNQGAVLILDEESGEELLRQRLRLLGAHVDNTQLPIWITCFQNPRLDTMEGQEELVSEITRVSASLVLIDSLIRVHSLDENSASEMKILMGGLARMAREQNCAVLVTHHARKPGRDWSNKGGDRLRGSTELKAAVDAHLYAKRSGQNGIQIEHEKARYVRVIDPFTVTISEPEDGTLRFYAGAGKQTKLARARDITIKMLTAAETPVLRTELEAACVAEDISARTFSTALESLKEEGRVLGENDVRKENETTKTFVAFSLA